jgi:hypothetical protein
MMKKLVILTLMSWGLIFGTVYFPWPPSINKLAGTRLLVSREYPNSKELLRQFNAALQRIKNNGMYAQILARYGIKQ